MNAFAEVNAVLSEASNTFDELRIIAKDEQKLTSGDREIVRRAADELQTTQTALISAYGNLIETNNKMMALNERLIETTKQLIEAQKKPLPTFPALSASFSGALVRSQPTYPR